MKMSVLYFSKSGCTKEMAEEIVNGIKSVEGMDAKAISISDVDADYLKASCGIIIGTPTYYASMASELKSWLDCEAKKYEFKGKLAGAFATANYVHGGGCIAIQNILTHLMTMGMVAYSGGGSYDNMTIHLGPVAIFSERGKYTETFRKYGAKMALMAKKLA